MNTRVTTVRLFPGESLPPVGSLDLIIALGGPMSVNEEDRYPWLGDEKPFLAEAGLRGDIPVLGLCLGAQLIASVLGYLVPGRPS